MAKEVFLELENSLYESPKIDVIEITTKDIVRTSLQPDQGGMEGGGQANPGWGI